MRYTSKENVIAYLGSTPEMDDANINKYIDAMSLLMDNMADRKLVAEAIGSGQDYEDRYYDGNNGNALRIDDAVVIDSVEIGDEYGENMAAITDFIAYPRLSPFNKILTKSTVFTKGIQNIKVSGSFGLFAEVPEDIEFACTVLVGGVIINQTLGAQAKTTERIGNYSVSYRTDKEFTDYGRAMDIISVYKKYTV